MAAILEMPQYVVYLKNVFIKLILKSHIFNILCTLDVLSYPTSMSQTVKIMITTIFIWMTIAP